MSLTREPKARTKKANALTDPRPTFISLVKAGANKTPFSAVKSVALVGQDAKDFIMSLKKHDIAKLTFKADAFKTEDAVKAWLTEGGYAGFTISTKAETGEFEVIGDEALVDIRRVECGGVVVYVGKAAEAEGETMSAVDVAKAVSEGRSAAVVAVKGEEAAPAAGAVPEAGIEGVVAPTAKEDEPVAEVLAEALAAPVETPAAPVVDAPIVVDAVKAEDIGAAAIPSAKIEGVQPVAPVDVAAAVVASKAVLDTLAAHGVQVPARKASMWTVQDLGGLLCTLNYLVQDQDWNGLSDADVATIKQAGASLITVLVGAMQNVIDKHVEAFKAEAQKAAKSEASPEIAALQASMLAMEERLTQLTADNAALATAKAAADAATAEAETRAKAAEEARKPHRKGADVGDSHTGTSEKPAAKKSPAEMSDREYLENRQRADTFGLVG